MDHLITPSLPPTSFRELAALVEALQGSASAIQVDIVDGVFAPHVSWPFTEGDPGAALTLLQTLTPHIAIEVDCMVHEPERYLETLLACGVTSVIVHFGSTEAYGALSTSIRSVGCKAGLAVTNDTDLDSFAPLVPLFDFVQVMGIKQVGAQGQPFDERALSTVANLRQLFPSLPLVVDGAVNTETLPRLKAAGATRFAPGSAIAKSEDPKDSYLQLVKLAAA